MKKLLIYSSAFAPATGGMETYVRLLAEGLCSQYAVTLATNTPAPQDFDNQFPFKVVRQPGPARLVKLILTSDVVQIAGPALVPMLMAYFFRKPYAIEQHGYQAICPNGLLLHEPDKTACEGMFMKGRYNQCERCAGAKSTALTFVKRWLCKRADRNIAVTKHVEKRLALPHSQTIYHGVPAKSLAESGKVPSFAYVGRLVSEKGIMLLLEATNQLVDRDFTVKLIGDGPERAAISEYIIAHDLSDRVTITGFLQGKEFEDVLSGVTAVVMPSIWEETAGLSVIEHMHRGRLVIAADIGGLGEVVGTAGMKFPAGNVSALASCMERIWLEPETVARLSIMARHRAVEQFGLIRMVSDHAKVYESLLGDAQ